MKDDFMTSLLNIDTILHFSYFLKNSCRDINSVLRVMLTNERG